MSSHVHAWNAEFFLIILYSIIIFKFFEAYMLALFFLKYLLLGYIEIRDALCCNFFKSETAFE